MNVARIAEEFEGGFDELKELVGQERGPGLGHHAGGSLGGGA
jgi:hypothetical protein